MTILRQSHLALRQVGGTSVKAIRLSYIQGSLREPKDIFPALLALINSQLRQQEGRKDRPRSLLTLRYNGIEKLPQLLGSQHFQRQPADLVYDLVQNHISYRPYL